MRRFIYTIIMLVSVFVCASATAQVALRSQFSAKFKPVIDGKLAEWEADDNDLDGSFYALGRRDQVGGEGQNQGSDDISAEYALVHNSDHLFIGMSIKDERLVPSSRPTLNQDHIELWFGVNNQNTNRLEPMGLAIFVDPTNKKEAVKIHWLDANRRRAGKKNTHVKGALAVTLDDYSIELAIPWSSFPKGVESRNGLRAALYVLDCDQSAKMSIESVIGTSSFATPVSAKTIPLLAQSDLTAPLERFWKDVKLRSNRVPHYTFASNLVGDPKPEQLVFAGQYIMAYGGQINTPKSYVSFRLPVRSANQIIDKRVQDLTGDGKDEIVVQFVQDTGASTRQWVSIYQMTEDMRFNKIFSAATLVSDGIVKVENKFKFIKGKGKTRAIVFTPSVAQGVDRSMMQEELPAEGGNPMVVPWDSPPKRKYVFHGGSFIQPYKGMR